MTAKANIAASVAARLLNRAKQTGDDYQILLTSYCLERFLYRLSAPDRPDRFVLKGAMLLRLWSERPYRATLDLDLLRRGDGSFDAIREDLGAIVATRVPPDAVDFDGDRIHIEPIREEDEYAGIRGTLPGALRRVAPSNTGGRLLRQERPRNRETPARERTGVHPHSVPRVLTRRETRCNIDLTVVFP